MIRVASRAALLVLVVGALVRCASPSERLLAEGMGFLDDAIAILEEHRGDEAAIVAELTTYVAEHREAFRDNTRQGRALLDAMPPAERELFVKRAREQLEPRMARVQALAQVYGNKVEILALVSAFNH